MLKVRVLPAELSLQQRNCETRGLASRRSRKSTRIDRISTPGEPRESAVRRRRNWDMSQFCQNLSDSLASQRVPVYKPVTIGARSKPAEGSTRRVNKYSAQHRIGPSNLGHPHL